MQDFPILYKTITGSHAYGVANHSSDKDIIGMFLPPKHTVLLDDYIHGFDKPLVYNDSYRYVDEVAKEDVQLFSVTKFFSLLQNSSTNVIESLFVTTKLRLVETDSSEILLDSRELFLTKHYAFVALQFAKGQFLEVKNYYTALKKMPKSRYHCIRMLLQAHEVLSDRYLDLESNKNILKLVRSETFSFKEFEFFYNQWFNSVSFQLENSRLPKSPDKEKVRKLLKEILNIEYSK